MRGTKPTCESLNEVYKYGNHLTPGLAEVSATRRLTCFLAEGFQARGFRGVPVLKAL